MRHSAPLLLAGHGRLALRHLLHVRRVTPLRIDAACFDLGRVEDRQTVRGAPTWISQIELSQRSRPARCAVRVHEVQFLARRLGLRSARGLLLLEPLVALILEGQWLARRRHAQTLLTRDLFGQLELDAAQLGS